MPTPEQYNGPEYGGEQPRSLERPTEALEKKVEVFAESKAEHDKNVEKARADVEQEAVSGRETSPSERKRPDNGPRVVHRTRKESYEHTMKSVQSEMSAPARAFSKIIHHPIVERTSEVVGSTVARPDAILSGSMFAFLLVLGLYLLARYNGFELRGSETIIAFVIGWIIGIIYDLLRATFTRRRK